MMVDASAAALKRRKTLRIQLNVLNIVAVTVISLATSVVFSIFGAILIYIIFQGASQITWSFLTLPPALFGPSGVGPEIFGTFYILFLTLIIAIPIGLGAAIYLNEYARPGRLVNTVRFAAETLAGVPTIVLGLFGFLIFNSVLGLGFSRLSGALTLVMLNLPLLVRISEDALSGVPQDMREASMALGGTKWQTIRKAVLPSAMPGLITGVIITAGKIIGETAALVLTLGTSPLTNNPYTLDPFAAGDTLTIHLWVLKTNDISVNSAQLAAGSATVLIILLLVFNVIARILGKVLVRYSGGR